MAAAEDAGLMTRIPTCPVKWCPQRTNPDFHQCWCGKLAVEHHDIVGGGMGGGGGHHKNPETIICLCHDHHEAVTTGGYKDAIEDRHYVVYNREGQRIVRVSMNGLEIGNAAAEAPHRTARPSQGNTSAAAPPASGGGSAGGAEADVKPRSSKEERPLEPATGRERVGSNPTGATPSGAALPASVLQRKGEADDCCSEG